MMRRLLALAMLLGFAHTQVARAQMVGVLFPSPGKQPDQILPAMGGPGGGQFFARCIQSDVLTGFDLTTGDDVDSITPICLNTGAGEMFPVVHAFTRKYGAQNKEVRPDGRLRCP